MPDLTNSEIIKRLLQTLVSKIGRRTHKSFAVVTLDNIIQNLETTYDLLQYVIIDIHDIQKVLILLA